MFHICVYGDYFALSGHSIFEKQIVEEFSISWITHAFMNLEFLRNRRADLEKAQLLLKDLSNLCLL